MRHSNGKIKYPERNRGLPVKEKFRLDHTETFKIIRLD